MKACPHCNGTNGYAVKVRALGYATHTGGWDGVTEKISDDSQLRFVSDKKGRCLDCGRSFLMRRLREA